MANMMNYMVRQMIKKLLLKSAERYAKRKDFKKEIYKIKYGKSEKPKMSMGKKLTIFLLINFTIVELSSLYLMWRFGDLSSMSSLITSVVGEVIALAVYQLKSLKENISDKGFVYELKMKDADENSVG